MAAQSRSLRSAASPRKLWIRSLDSVEAHELPGTEAATYPFWSPDGRSLAFFADGKLKLVNIAGGPPLTIADTVFPRGGSWGEDGTILFTPQVSGGMARVPAAGGKAAPLSTPDYAKGEVSHRWVHFLPEGRRLLYYSQSLGTGKHSHRAAIRSSFGRAFGGSGTVTWGRTCRLHGGR
jgi:hypothetical protein